MRDLYRIMFHPEPGTWDGSVRACIIALLFAPIVIPLKGFRL